MKKLLTLCLLVFMCVALGDMMMPQEAHALLPLACSTAADLGWRNWGWNVLCVWFLQMEGYNNNGDGWSAHNDQPDQSILATMQYATTTDRRDIRYPLRA